MIRIKTARFLAVIGNGGLLASIAALLRWGPAALPGILFFALLLMSLVLLKCPKCRSFLFQRRGRWLRYWGLTLPKACPHCGAAVE